MKEIGWWFRGPIVCHGVNEERASYGSGDTPLCLAMNANGGVWHETEEHTQLAAVIDDLFPERSCRCSGNMINKLIHFNNHPDTTIDQVNKVIWEYNLRYPGE